ncbi:hypothetical protein Pan97_26570 [Bremerella volcania]|uniref:DUF2157 domain-containing protein n=1 Tax=Bremerella volcania TaxID=2527984 RepID=A0A518C8S3_9BACT|nr:hypothetical protein [Bremerella volcania]QDU75623.1 hypothetical protein Pan97_26570 [Bremerella volcania]
MSSSDRQQDLRLAIQFAMQNLKYWKLDDNVQAFYETWLRRLDAEDEPCEHLEPPSPDERPRGVRQQLRYRAFLDHELDRHVREGRLSEQLVANLQKENWRIENELRGEVNPDEPHQRESTSEDAESGDEPSSDDGSTAHIDQQPAISIAGNLLEAVLDPRSLQYLMMLGSALLVLGLVIWLATQGFFDDPMVIAVCAAIVNLAVLGFGAYLLRCTRFETAGRGLTLLACLVMPLHLWFYDAQGLIVLDEGGHLWIPALAIAVLYAVCAILVRDSLFAYAMVGGITLTGLMILGDQSIARFWEGAAVSSLLIAIGAVAIHVERAFVPGDGPFNRDDFGKAFYRAGHCVLLGGLIVLVSWAVSSWSYGGILSDVWNLWRSGPLPFDKPSLATSYKLKILATGLSLSATYLYGYSYFVVTRKPILLGGGIATFLWAEVMLVDALPVPVTEELIMMVLAVTAIFFQAFAWSIRGIAEKDGEKHPSISASTVMQTVACLFLLAPLAMGIAGYLRSSFYVFSAYEITPLFTAALAATAASGWIGYWLTQNRQNYLNAIYAVSSCAAVLLASFGGLALLQWEAWDLAGPLLMMVPLGYLLISTRYANQSRTHLQLAAVCGTCLLTVAVLVLAYGLSIRRIEPLTGHASEMMLAAFLLEVSLFFGMYSISSKQSAGNFLALLAGSAAVVQFEHYLGTSYEFGLFTFGLIGLVVLFVDRLFELENSESSNGNRSFGLSGQLLLSIAGMGSVLLALNRLMMVGFHDGTLVLLLGMIVSSLLAALIVVPRMVSRWYVALAILQGGAALLLVAFGLKLEPWQKLEILLAVLGVVILIASHIGWVQEGERQDDWVTLGLVVGSLLFAVPMLTGLLGQRLDFYSETTRWGLVHEIGAIVVGLSLLGTGILFRIRSTTIVGAIAMLLYLGTLVVYVHLPERLQSVAVYMMIGGGIFFIVSMLLSIFRDYLLAMPERFRNRRGLFRVLTWR